MNRGILWYIYHVRVLSPILWLFRSRYFSRFMGFLFRVSFSRVLIAPLSRLYHISLYSYIVPEGGFQTLNDFFIRETRPEFRQFSSDTKILGSPADSCIEIFRDISPDLSLNVKGYKTNLLKLYGPDVADFIGGDLCFCRLRFSDYHRFHFFDQGEVISFSERNGPLYSVDNSVLDTGLWIQNKSHCMRLRTKNFGDVLWLEVGATNVGSITNHKKLGEIFTRSEEKGYFELGGSAILLVFQKNLIQWSPELLQKSLLKEELEVIVGQVLGSSI